MSFWTIRNGKAQLVVFPPQDTLDERDRWLAAAYSSGLFVSEVCRIRGHLATFFPMKIDGQRLLELPRRL